MNCDEARVKVTYWRRRQVGPKYSQFATLHCSVIQTKLYMEHHIQFSSMTIQIFKVTNIKTMQMEYNKQTTLIADEMFSGDQLHW